MSSRPSLVLDEQDADLCARAASAMLDALRVGACVKTALGRLVLDALWVRVSGARGGAALDAADGAACGIIEWLGGRTAR